MGGPFLFCKVKPLRGAVLQMGAYLSAIHYEAEGQNAGDTPLTPRT